MVFHYSVHSFLGWLTPSYSAGGSLLVECFIGLVLVFSLKQQLV